MHDGGRARASRVDDDAVDDDGAGDDGAGDRRASRVHLAPNQRPVPSKSTLSVFTHMGE